MRKLVAEGSQVFPLAFLLCVLCTVARIFPHVSFVALCCTACQLETCVGAGKTNKTTRRLPWGGRKGGAPFCISIAPTPTPTSQWIHQKNTHTHITVDYECTAAGVSVQWDKKGECLVAVLRSEDCAQAVTEGGEGGEAGGGEGGAQRVSRKP